MARQYSVEYIVSFKCKHLDAPNIDSKFIKKIKKAKKQKDIW